MIGGRFSLKTMEIYQLFLVGTDFQIEHTTCNINACMPWFVFFFHAVFRMNLAEDFRLSH